MNIKYLLLLLYFSYVNSFIDKSIIKIPGIKGRYKNISTKNGFINYEFNRQSIETAFSRFPVYSLIYRLEGIKN